IIINGFAQEGINPSNQFSSKIVKLELEIDADLPLPISRKGVIPLLKPNYVALNVVKANCPVSFGKVYVSGNYLSVYSLYSKRRITLTGIATKVNQIPGLYICSWGSGKIPTYYILTPVCDNLLQL
ncbi:MAG TPA: hypothetical protein VFV31_09800, partial [Chitinophagaceae bacterium]|nr:hypothetical protein [Chitinophagaceae bacterium]